MTICCPSGDQVGKLSSAIVRDSSQAAAVRVHHECMSGAALRVHGGEQAAFVRWATTRPRYGDIVAQALNPFRRRSSHRCRRAPARVRDLASVWRPRRTIGVGLDPARATSICIRNVDTEGSVAVATGEGDSWSGG